MSYAESLAVDGDVVKGTRKVNGGIESVEVTLPAVCSVMETMNTPRQPKVRGTMMAKKAVFDVLRLEDLGLDAQEAGKAGSATQVTELFAPEPHPVGTMISGATAAEAAKHLVGTLAEKKLL